MLLYTYTLHYFKTWSHPEGLNLQEVIKITHLKKMISSIKNLIYDQIWLNYIDINLNMAKNDHITSQVSKTSAKELKLSGLHDISHWAIHKWVKVCAPISSR